MSSDTLTVLTRGSVVATGTQHTICSVFPNEECSRTEDLAIYFKVLLASGASQPFRTSQALGSAPVTQLHDSDLLSSEAGRDILP